MVFGLGMFVCAPTYATYNKKCIEHLEEEHPPEFTNLRQIWNQSLMMGAWIHRPLSEIEFEAFMDSTHDLPLIAKFSGGKKVTFTYDKDSDRNFLQFINRTELIDVVYLPDSLEKLGALYKNACELLQRSDCDAYLHYTGLGNSQPRPLTQLEEQAIKWCTFHMASQKSMATSMQAARKSGVPASDIEGLHKRAAAERSRSALKIIISTFSEKDAGPLYLMLIQPYIAASFDHVYRLYKGEVPH